MRNMLKKVFSAKAKEAVPARNVFATSQFAYTNGVTGDTRYHCLVATERDDGQWDVGQQTVFERLAGGAGGISGGGILQAPVTVDGNTAYEMLQRYEDVRSEPGSGYTSNPTFKWAGHYTEMADIAKQARVHLAAKSGGVAMRIAAKRRQKSPGKKPGGSALYA